MSANDDLQKALEGAPDLIAGDMQPRGLTDLINNLLRRVHDLEHAGLPRRSSSKRIPLGNKDDTLVVTGGLEFDAEAAAAFEAATAISSDPNNVLITDGAGAQKGNAVGANEAVVRVGSGEIDGLAIPAQSLMIRQAADLIALTLATNEVLLRAGGNLANLAMATNTLLMRAGGDIQALAMGASTIFARLAAGNAKACTPAEILTLIAAASTNLDNLVAARKTGNYTALQTDCVLMFNLSGAAALTLPSNHPVDGKIYIVSGHLGTPSVTKVLTINPGAGDTINNAASITTGAVAGRVMHLVWDKTDRDWAAN